MNKLTAQIFGDDVASFMKQSTLGFDDLLDVLNETPMNPSNFPAYDLIDDGDGKSKLQVAVAGYGKSDIGITVENNVLSVKGTKAKEEVTYFYNGIAKRNFTVRFPILNSVEVTGAELEDGILTITLEVAEDKRPKSIEIK